MCGCKIPALVVDTDFDTGTDKQVQLRVDPFEICITVIRIIFVHIVAHHLNIGSPAFGVAVKVKQRADWFRVRAQVVGELIHMSGDSFVRKGGPQITGAVTAHIQVDGVFVVGINWCCHIECRTDDIF